MDHIGSIQRSLDYIEENLKTTITPEELSEMAHLSLFHYYRLFQSAVGMPVVRYIVRRRLLWAAYEMAQGAKQVDAALMYGFDTAAGFYKAFRREFGCSPREYQKRFRVRKPYRICLLQEEHIMITQKRIREILTNWDLQEAEICPAVHPAGGASENTFFVGGGYTLKVYANPGKAKTDGEITQALHDAKLSQGELIWTKNGEAWASDGELCYLLTSRIDGTGIQAEQLYTQPGMARYYGGIIGRLDRVLKENDRILCSERDIFSEVTDCWLASVKAAGLTEEFCREYREVFGGIHSNLPRQIIHRDPNPSNILLKEGALAGIVDFELTQRSIRIFDPCYAATAVLSETFGREDRDRWFQVYKEILRGYDETAGLAPEEKQALPYVVLSIQIICVGWFSIQEQYQDIAKTNISMLRWLLDNREKLNWEEC